MHPAGGVLHYEAAQEGYEALEEHDAHRVQDHPQATSRGTRAKHKDLVMPPNFAFDA